MFASGADGMHGVPSLHLVKLVPSLTPAFIHFIRANQVYPQSGYSTNFTCHQSVVDGVEERRISSTQLMQSWGPFPSASRVVRRSAFGRNPYSRQTARLVDGLQQPLHRRQLEDLVLQRRNAERASLTVLLRYLYPSHRLRMISAGVGRSTGSRRRSGRSPYTRSQVTHPRRSPLLSSDLDRPRSGAVPEWLGWSICPLAFLSLAAVSVA
jgi:hypothetical protein